MRTTWNHWIAGLGTAALSLAIAPAIGWAADYSAMPTDELMEMRGTMRDAPAEEHERFRVELDKRVREMTTEERQAYGLGSRAGVGPGAADLPGPGAGPGIGYGDGTRPRPMDGTGFGGGRGGGPRR